MWAPAQSDTSATSNFPEGKKAREGLFLSHSLEIDASNFSSLIKRKGREKERNPIKEEILGREGREGSERLSVLSQRSNLLLFLTVLHMQDLPPRSSCDQTIKRHLPNVRAEEGEPVFLG